MSHCTCYAIGTSLSTLNVSILNQLEKKDERKAEQQARAHSGEALPRHLTVVMRVYALDSASIMVICQQKGLRTGTAV